MSSQRVTLYTDGACSGNPGPGGWGVVMLWGDHRKTMKGGEADTERAARIVLDEFRAGKIARVTLERPEEAHGAQT